MTSGTGCSRFFASALAVAGCSVVAVLGSCGGEEGPRCGDGHVDSGEECDEGSANDELGACKSDCAAAVCGDGLVGPEEACDDANDDPTDDCDACAAARCGDGVVRTDVEACDDGVNDGAWGGCRADCTLAPHCGDGTTDAPNEACDDGNVLDGDGCNTDCAESAPEVWTVTFDGRAEANDGVRDVAVDGEGNIVVAGHVDDGFEGQNFCARGYDAAGQERWTDERDSAAHGDDLAEAVTVDASGDFIVVGELYNTLADWDVRVVAYDPSGSESWTFSAISEFAYGVDAAGSDLVVVGADYDFDTDHDIAVAKYTDLEEQWYDEYTGSGVGADGAFDAVIDGDGTILVGGYFDSGVDDDAWLRRYEADGGEVWTQTYNTVGNPHDRLYGLAIDGSGNIAIAGRRGDDVWVGLYDTRGNELWSVSEPGEPDGDSSAWDVAFDTLGRPVFVGCLRAPGALDRSIWIRKYDASGQALWTRTHDEIDGGNDCAYGVTIDGDGNTIVAGSVETTSHGRDGWIRKYGP